MGMRFLGSVCRVRTSRAGVGSVTGFSEPDVMHIPTRRYPSVQRRPIPLSGGPRHAAPAPALARRRPRVVLLADRDQGDDPDQTGPGEELRDPLVQEEVADDRQREVRLHQLAERVDQREEQHAEADHREPVRHRHDRQPRHPRVPEELTQQRHRPGALVTRTGGVGLTEAEDGQELPDDPCEQGDPHEGDHSTDDERDDLKRRHGRHSTGQ
jgi:hypothetical protein